jgi:hypothetical protein
MVYGSAASRGDLEPIQPPIQQVMRAPSQGMKWQRREADQSLSSSAEVKKVELNFYSLTCFYGIVPN